MSAKFDIPVNFTVLADNEVEAEQTLHGMFDRMIMKYGLENVIAYKDFEFLTEKSCNSRCGNNHCC